MPRSVIILSLLLFASSVLRAGERKFDFTPACRQAYGEIIKLKLAAGQQLINAEKERDPDNLIPVFLENYIDFFILFFNEDPAEYKARKGNMDKRLSLLDEGPESSPWFLYTRSIIHFQWAAVKVKFGNHWDAGWAFRRSFLQASQNKKKFPAFQPNIMLTGAMQVAAGTIPDGYKWLANMLGMKGSIRGGMQQLAGFLGNNEDEARLFRDEGIFYYLYLKFHIENKPDEVFTYIRRHNLDLKTNHLFTYLAANLALNNKQSALAKTIINNRAQGSEYLQTPIWNLELGYAKINHLESDAAVYLERFVNQFKGKFYVRDALQKLSWHYYLNGNQPMANKYRSLIPKMGGNETDADKLALKEAKSGQWPHPVLLRARLLNDGGYHQEAFSQLNGKGSSDFTRPEDKVEFAYRLGRIYYDLNREADAIQAYLVTIKTGRDRKEYFAARAALQLGMIYEKKGQMNMAIAYYQTCLELPDHDFKNSLDQKAKAGIARCKNQ